MFPPKPKTIQWKIGYKAFNEARSVSLHVASTFVDHDHSKEGRRFASFLTC